MMFLKHLIVMQFNRALLLLGLSEGLTNVSDIKSVQLKLNVLGLVNLIELVGLAACLRTLNHIL
jgi:hypothetical protein